MEKGRMQQAQSSETASMSNFIDFVLADGVKRVSTLADFRRTKESIVVDFYKPIREVIVEIHRRSQDPAQAFDALMARTTDARAARIFPVVASGYLRWLGEAKPERAFKAASSAIPAGVGLSIPVNPEIGLVLGGERHHLKLYLRAKEPIPQKRVDLTIALMAAALDVDRRHKLAVLDVPRSKLHYLSAKSAEPRAWQRLQTLVAMEAASYATGWGRV